MAPVQGDGRLPLSWTPREVPLPPRAVVARGPAAVALGHRLAALGDDALRALTAVAGAGALVVLGEPDRLPWVEGVTYLGRDDEAPELLLPTALAPVVPAAVLARGVELVLASRPGSLPRPLALLPAPLQLIACGRAREIERARLAAWLASTTSEVAAAMAKPDGGAP